MDPVVVVLLLLALVLSGLATFGIVAGRFNLLAAAFACYVLSVLVPMF